MCWLVGALQLHTKLGSAGIKGEYHHAQLRYCIKGFGSTKAFLTMPKGITSK